MRSWRRLTSEEDAWRYNSCALETDRARCQKFVVGAMGSSRLVLPLADSFRIISARSLYPHFQIHDRDAACMDSRGAASGNDE